MILIRLISWPYLRKHVLRTTLTTTGIILGVTVFVAMHAANQNIVAAFSKTVDRIAGKTQLQVTTGDTGFNEDVLDKVQSAATVQIAVPVIEAVVGSHLRGQGDLLVLGVDMTGDRSLREYTFENGEDSVIDDPLIFLAQPDSLIVSKEFSEKSHLEIGAQLKLATAEGDKGFTIRGIMRSTGLTSAYGGNLAVMDIYAAQQMFGRGRTFDRIDLTVKPGATLDQCERELAALLGPAFEIQSPANRGQHFESMLAGYSMMANISSAFTLFIAMFIIYNSFAIAVTQRRSEIAILRALGATRGQIQNLFLTESALIGIVGSMAGVVLGLAIAQAVVPLISALIADVYGVSQQVDPLRVNPSIVALAAGIGILSSLAGAAIPARHAARLDPVQALHKGGHLVPSAADNRIRRVAAILLAGLCVVCFNITISRIIFYAGYVAAVAVALLLAPTLSMALARAMRPLMQRLRPVEGSLAADSLIAAPRRTSASVAALMLSVALVVAFDGMARASYASIVEWTNTTLNPDLFVVGSENVNLHSTRFPPGMASEIAELPGVASVQTLRNAKITFRGTSVMAIAIDVNSVDQPSQRAPVSGEAAEMYREAGAGRGLMVSDNFAQLQHVAVGDVLDIDAPYGRIHLPIVGIIVDYSDQQGTIVMDRRVFIGNWHDDTVNMFRVYLQPGGQAAAVRTAILQRYEGHRQLFVLTNSELKGHVLKVAGQWFQLTLVQIVVAVLVAIFGIANTLTVSITDRRRELAVLRALGAFRSQIRRTIWIEALGVAAMGLVLGSAFGAINLYYVLQIVQRDIAGLRLDYVFPTRTVLMLVPAILAAAFAAAIWPAELARRGSLVEALEYE